MKSAWSAATAIPRAAGFADVPFRSSPSARAVATLKTLRTYAQRTIVQHGLVTAAFFLSFCNIAHQNVLFRQPTSHLSHFRSSGF